MNTDSALEWLYRKNVPIYAGIAIAALAYLWLAWKAIKGKPGGLLIGLLLAAVVAAVYLYIEEKEP